MTKERALFPLLLLLPPPAAVLGPGGQAVPGGVQVPGAPAGGEKPRVLDVGAHGRRRGHLQAAGGRAAGRDLRPAGAPRLQTQHRQVGPGRVWNGSVGCKQKF